MTEPRYSSLHKDKRSSIKGSGTVSYSKIDFTSADYVKLNGGTELVPLDEAEQVESGHYSKLNRKPLISDQVRTPSVKGFSGPVSDDQPSKKHFEYEVNPHKKSISGGIKCALGISIVLILILLLTLLVFCVFFWFEISELKKPCSVPEQSTGSSLSDQVFNAALLQNMSRIDDRILQQLGGLQDQITQIIDGLEGQYPTFPTLSCSALPPSSPSGYYWVRASNGSAVRVYCEMTVSCGNVTGGWMRAYNLDMTDSRQECPSSLRLREDRNLRTCGIGSDNEGCSEVMLPTNGVFYSRVCGRIKAYQVGSSDTFGDTGRGTGLGIDENYVDGVSLTYGNPRQHIWTFAAGLDEVATHPEYNCPCTNVERQMGNPPIPPFVDEDYFCDTGSPGTFRNGIFYNEDPLWDGAGCGRLNACCDLNSPPWFYKELQQPIADDIGMRVCSDQPRSDEDTPIEIIEIYVK